jgi:hypothetical protein
MATYDEKYLQTPSQRQLAEQLEVSRCTLQHWLARKKEIEAEPEVVAFLESPVGQAFLHRLVLAAHLVITLVGPGGIRLVCLFLELTGLNQFVATSYGPHWQVSVALEQAIDEFDQAEKNRCQERRYMSTNHRFEMSPDHRLKCLLARLFNPLPVVPPFRLHRTLAWLDLRGRPAASP